MDQEKKSSKWGCKLCGEKQSLQRVYARSHSAKDCRLVVQVSAGPCQHLKRHLSSSTPCPLLPAAQQPDRTATPPLQGYNQARGAAEQAADAAALEHAYTAEEGGAWEEDAERGGGVAAPAAQPQQRWQAFKGEEEEVRAEAGPSGCRPRVEALEGAACWDCLFRAIALECSFQHPLAHSHLRRKTRAGRWRRLSVRRPLRRSAAAAARPARLAAPSGSASRSSGRQGMSWAAGARRPVQAHRRDGSRSSRLALRMGGRSRLRHTATAGWAAHNSRTVGPQQAVGSSSSRRAQQCTKRCRLPSSSRLGRSNSSSSTPRSSSSAHTS